MAALYLVIVALVLVLFIGVGAIAYVRIYRNPVVKHTSDDPGTVTKFRLSELPGVDKALLRARWRAETLTMAGVPEERWARVVRAAGSAEGAIQAFAEAIGATLGEPLRDLPAQLVAHAVTLPELMVRFAQKSVIAAVSGRILEHGGAVAVAGAVHQGGSGPRQAIVLDLTAEQNAHTALGQVSRMSLVVLTANELRDLILDDAPGRALEAALVRQLRMAELSPYQTAGGVDSESLFFGRERELRTMADRALRSFLLVGARQMGKSTLLKAIRRRMVARGDVDVEYVTLADGDLGHHLLHHLDPGARRRSTPGATPGAMSVDEVRDIVAGTRQRPRLWLIDEADRFVVEDAASDYVLTRMLRQLTQDGLAYFVLAGFWELYAATVLHARHPLLNFAELVRLEPLDRDAAWQLASRPMESLGLAWDGPGAVEWLLRGTGRRANLIVLACKGMIESLTPDTRTLTRERLEELVQRDKDLGDQLRVLRQDVYTPLDRALFYQALLLEERGEAVTRAATRKALAGLGLDASADDVEQAFDRLELGYVLVDEGERLGCPVPFMQERSLRAGDMEERIRDCIEDWRAARPG